VNPVFVEPRPGGPAGGSKTRCENGVFCADRFPFPGLRRE